MSHRDLTDAEMQKVFLMYEEYQGNPAAFIRELWGEAYDLGKADAPKAAWVEGYNEGIKWERARKK